MHFCCYAWDMPTLFRWIFYGCLSRVLGITLALLAIFFIIEAFDKSRYLGHGLQPGLLIEYMLLKTPFMITEFMPIILLLAATMYLTELSRHNELVIMRAAGLGIPKVLFPMLFVAALAAILSFIIGEWVTPITNKRLDAIERIHIQHKPERQRGIQWLKEENRFFRLQPLGGDVFGLIMLETDKKGGWLRRMDAARAMYANGQWRLTDVHISQPTAADLRLQHVKTMDLPASIGPNTADPPKPRYMNFLELKRYAHDLNHAGLAAVSFDFSLHRKLAAPITCLVMVLLATALCAHLGNRTSAASWGMVAAIALGLIYYVLGSTGSMLSTGERLPAAFAAWLPNMVFAGLGGFLLLHREGY